MAHGNYDCCAVCDRKMAFGGERTKEDICAYCAVALAEKGVFAKNADALKEWMTSEAFDPALLLGVGFSRCHYTNDIDTIMKPHLGGTE